MKINREPVMLFNRSRRMYSRVLALFISTRSLFDKRESYFKFVMRYGVYMWSRASKCPSLIGCSHVLWLGLKQWSPFSLHSSQLARVSAQVSASTQNIIFMSPSLISYDVRAGIIWPVNILRCPERGKRWKIWHWAFIFYIWYFNSMS